MCKPRRVTYYLKIPMIRWFDFKPPHRTFDLSSDRPIKALVLIPVCKDG